MDRADRDMFFALLRSAVCGGRLDESERWELSPRQLGALMQLGRRHDIAHLVAAAAKKEDLKLPCDSDRAVYTAVYRGEQMAYELENICTVLEQAAVDHIPLKGAVVRQYYPEPWMRTSCDIDLLVRAQDADGAIAALAAAGYMRTEDNSVHDFCLRSPGGVHIELHHTLTQDGAVKRADKILEGVWDECSAKDGWQHRQQMSGEMLIFYHLAHMAKHLLSGGCGVRSFVDLWLMENKISIDKSRLHKLLEMGGLDRFYGASHKLAQVWLDKKAHTETTQELESYVLRGGVYGSCENAACAEAAVGVGRLRSFFRMMFLPRSNLCVIYPRLASRPYLAPLYQVRRWLRIFDKNKRSRLNYLTRTRAAVPDGRAEATGRLLDEIGLL